MTRLPPRGRVRSLIGRRTRSTFPIELTMTSTPDRCMGCGEIDARTMLGAILCQDCEEIVESSRHAMSLITEVTDQPR